jgi:hypothetical protein
MSNEVMIPSGAALPAHILAAVKANPNLLQSNMDAANGIGAGAPPTITANQGMFKTKIDGVEDVIQLEVPGMGKINAPKISAVILAGKPALDRAWFATAYTQGSEPASPDCSSEDGVRPKADSPNKQCESCAGCAQNMWGSAKLQDGTPGKGKACGEKKRLALYANNGVFRFNVPPASLGDFAAYARQLGAHGLPLSGVITTIAFDPDTPTKLVFGFQAILPEPAFNKLQALAQGDEVKAIMQGFAAAPAAPAQIAEKPAAAAGPTPEEVAAAAKKAEDDKKAEAAAKKKADAAAAKKKADDEKKAADAAASAGSAGLGIDLGMDLNTSSEGEIAAGDPGVGSGEPSDDELAALFSV